MKHFELKGFLSAIAMERERMHWELEDSEGEVTETVLSQEEKVNALRELFRTEGGIDAVGRYVKESQARVQARKEEKAYAERHLKIEEEDLADFLWLVNEALEQEDLDKVKGKFGYSFTAHTSVTTKADNKMIKELFHEKVMAVIRESGVVPEDITITLSASSSLLPEGAEKPQWYNTTTRGKAKFLKPRKQVQEDLSSDEF